MALTVTCRRILSWRLDIRLTHKTDVFVNLKIEKGRLSLGNTIAKALILEIGCQSRSRNKPVDLEYSYFARAISPLNSDWFSGIFGPPCLKRPFVQTKVYGVPQSNFFFRTDWHYQTRKVPRRYSVCLSKSKWFQSTISFYLFFAITAKLTNESLAN